MDGRMRAPQKSKRVGLNNKQQLKVRSTSKIPEFETDKRADKKSMEMHQMRLNTLREIAENLKEDSWKYENHHLGLIF